MSNEYDNFAVDPSTIGQDWKGGIEMRPLSNRMSNFGALDQGNRRSDDYTRTTFENAHEENPKAVVGAGFGTDSGFYDYNPYVWGSTVKKVLDDKLFKMGEGGISVFHVDVSDRKEVSASGMLQYKNYPSEGWSSFGRKYDKHRTWQGNTWIA